MYNVQFYRLARRPIKQSQSSYLPMFSKTTWFPSSPLLTARHADTTHTESVWRKTSYFNSHVLKAHNMQIRISRLFLSQPYTQKHVLLLTAISPPRKSSSSPPLEVKDINIVHPKIHSKACSQHHLVFPNTHRLCQHVILDYIYA